MCENLEIDSNPLKFGSADYPPWEIDLDCINTSLHRLCKHQHDPSHFRVLFRGLQENMREYNYVFTDGSKLGDLVSFSVTTEFNLITTSILPSYSSVLSAELIAIYTAFNLLSKRKGKYAICSDSLSSIKMVENIDNFNPYAVSIRNILIREGNRFSLIWIPGHCNINGNEYADLIARHALRAPLITTNNHNPRDMDKYIKNFFLNQDDTYLKTSHWYRNINANKTNLFDYMKLQINRIELTKFLRIRLGHTRLTHGFLLNIHNIPTCNCNTISSTSPEHFLCNCPQYNRNRVQIFKNINPLDLISNPSLEAINTIILFLKTSLYKHI